MINAFQSNVAFHIETNMIGFYRNDWFLYEI